MDRRTDRVARWPLGRVLVGPRFLRERSRSGSPRPTKVGRSIGTGPAMSDFFPWLWAPDSSKILMMPEDGSTPSAYLIDPEGGA